MTEKTKPKLGINRRSFQKWGAEGGKIGGAKNKKKKGYFQKIGSLGGKAKRAPSKKYLKEISKISRIVDLL